MKDNIYKDVLSFDIEELRKINNISDKDIEYFDLLYKDLNENSYYTKMALMAISYSFEKDISLIERESFIRGMSNYIDVYKLFNNIETFKIETEETKRKVVINFLKEAIKLNEESDMYQRGLASATKLVSLAIPEEKVRKKKH